MKTVVLIRHGQSLGQTCHERGLDRKDPSLVDCFLSSKGIREACALRSNAFLQQFKFDLICVSPLTRAIATCMLGLGNIIDESIEEDGVVSIPIVARADICEVGSKIPENHGRPVQALVKDLTHRLYTAGPPTKGLEYVDFTMLPASWPDIHDGRNHAHDNAGFLQWLDSRPEETVAVVCHYNIIKGLLGRRIQHVMNCAPIECIFTDEGDLLTKSEYDSGFRIPKMDTVLNKKKNRKKSSKRRTTLDIM